MRTILFSLLLILISSKNLRNNAAWDFETFYSQLVTQHNTLRSKHRAGALTKLAAIATMAKKTTDQCAKLGKLQHTKDYYQSQPVGQNLYLSSRAPSAADVLQGWYYEEEPHYNYATGKSKDGEVTGHFTQVVWKSSKQIGCAYTVGKWSSYPNSYYVCCNYFPAGNYANKYVANVHPKS